jgi:trehalose 6-phosphate synthase
MAPERLPVFTRFMPTWNAVSLRSWLTRINGNEPIVVLANCAPFRHEQLPNGSVAVRRSSGGLVTALEPLMKACTGVWVAHGDASADRIGTGPRAGLDAPRATSRFRVRRVWLSPRETRGYYDGFSNEGLWPLCHRTPVTPIFRAQDFEAYRTVNARFAEAVSGAVESESPVVLVQDYHLALAPQMIRARLPRASVVAFWHAPFPNPEAYRICPWGRQLLEGLLGSSIVGFQTPADAENFCAAVSMLGVRVENEAVEWKGREVHIRTYPVSIEWPSRWIRQSPPVATCRDIVRRRLGLPPDVRLVVGVDRLDYTKGINEKLLAIERLLDTCPEFRQRFVLVQIAEPSRTSLPAYRDARACILATADRIARRYSAPGYRPVTLLEAHHHPAEVFHFLRAADVCYVGSLHDGMNLVAKEFVGARDDEAGVLILSESAGAARELKWAVPVNPLSPDSGAAALVDALCMSVEEQQARMRAMRRVVAEFNSCRWAAGMVTDAVRLRRPTADWPRLQPEAHPMGAAVSAMPHAL